MRPIGECLRGHQGVFNLKRRPWPVPARRRADLVAEIVERARAEPCCTPHDGPRRLTETNVTSHPNGSPCCHGDIEYAGRVDGCRE